MAPAFSIDKFVSFYSYVSLQGWACDPGARLERVCIRQDGHRYGQADTGLPSPLIALGHDLRFELTTLVPGLDWSKAIIELTFDNGRSFDLTLDAVDARREELAREDHRAPALDVALQAFANHLAKMPNATLLDIGARARSGNVHRHLFPNKNYIGVDIVDGENVDIVCDAHDLASAVPHGSVDAVFSASTFEHLLMPWKVAIELNKVMRIGGIGYISTHQTLGMHDMPCDFWRFSDAAWRGLFNVYTGFEVLESYLGIPMHIIPFDMAAKWIGHEAAVGFALSSVAFRKIGSTALAWDVPAREISLGAYPE